MKFQQIIFALSRIIQVLISFEYTLFNIIPKSLVTLQFLKFLIVQIKAYIQGFQMRYQSFLGHWYPNSYSWFSDSMDILFVLITTVHGFLGQNLNRLDFEVIAGYLEKRISVPQGTLGEMKNISFIHYYREFGGNMGTKRSEILQ